MALPVKLLESFGSEQEQVKREGIRYELGYLVEGPSIDINLEFLAHDLQYEHHQCRTGAERRRKKTRRENRCIPERSRNEPVVKKSGHRVNANRPGDRQQDERHDHLVGLTAGHPEQNVKEDEGVDCQVTIQNQNVPREQRVGKIRASNDWSQVP